MKGKFEKLKSAVFLGVLLFVSAIFVTVYSLNSRLSFHYFVNEGEELKISENLPVTAVKNEQDSREVISGSNYNVELKLLGVIPIKTASVSVVDEMYVVPIGKPFGIKLYTDGVLIVGMTDITIDGKKVNPARDAGLKIGDFIKTVNGKEVLSNDDISEIITSSNGAELKITAFRGNKQIDTLLKPVFSAEDKRYRAGIWVRDSSAGIGTMTYYSPFNNVVAGLGHGICDVDTGSLMTANSGEMVSAQIIDCKKGQSGEPGELKGRFGKEVVSNLEINSETGIYGVAQTEFNGEPLKVALKQEIEEGKAEILSTVEGDEPKLYECIIERVKHNEGSLTQNMVISVTDQALLQKTGGIVQGMSGSPVIQNGKLVGAVTHVLVDDPSKGYAIFAENMLETAESIVEDNLKTAS